MSYLTFKIISIIVAIVMLLVVLASRRDKEKNEKEAPSAPDDDFQAWLKQASIYDMEKMLKTTLIKIEPQYYKTDVNVTANDFQSRMKILYEALPKDIRANIYPDESVLLDYIQGSIDENPYLSPIHQKRDNLYMYFLHNFSNEKLIDSATMLKVMCLANTENDRWGETEEIENLTDSKGKKINYKAIHDEMYYVEYKLIPHFVCFFRKPTRQSITDNKFYI